MGKTITRNILMSFLVAASLGSYIFLDSVSGDELAPAPGHPALELKQTLEKDGPGADADQPEVILPDVTLLKHIFEVGKRFLPMSR